MTNKNLPDDDFDVAPTVPGHETQQNPFDDLDFDAPDQDIVRHNELSPSAFDPRYQEIANELSQMDAAAQQDFDQAVNEWDISDVSSDTESLDDLSLNDQYEPAPENEDHDSPVGSAQYLMSDPHISPAVELEPTAFTQPFDHDLAKREHQDQDVWDDTAASAPSYADMSEPPASETGISPGRPEWHAEDESQPRTSYRHISPNTDFNEGSAPLPSEESAEEYETYSSDSSIATMATDLHSSLVAGDNEKEYFETSGPQQEYDGPNEFDDETDTIATVSTVTDNDDFDTEEYDAVPDDDGDDVDIPPPAVTNGTRIPLIDLGPLGFDKMAFSFHKRTRAVHNILKRHYSIYGIDLLTIIDRKCAEWLSRSKTPYRVEIEDMAKKFKQPGIYALNLFFEFGCTSAVAADPEGGMRLLHTMDWSIKGIGHLLTAARRHGDNGTWVNITWPGYVGCLQGIAPGRFAAVINQAPTGNSKQPWMNWISSKMKWKGKRDMPPAFLLRKVFEECKDFDSAVSMIEKTPICFPAIFSIVGVQEGEFAIIERTENDRKTTKRQTAVTNHWLNSEFSGRSIGYKSEDRLVTIKSRLNKGVENWSWLRAPVLNPTTRMAIDLNPATARMRVIGYEGVDPVTIPLDIYVD